MTIRNRYLVLFFLLIFTGLLAGTAAPELFHMGTGTYAGFFSLYAFQKYETAQVRAWDLFPYLTSVRLRTFLFLWMSSFTSAGLLFHLTYVWWLAASAGMLLALFALRDGAQGLLLFACSLFPQWLLYGALGRREAVFLMRQHAAGSGGVHTIRRQTLLELLSMTGLCLAGCACEAFLGTWVLKIFLQNSA